MEEIEKVKALLLQNQKIIRYASENVSLESSFTEDFVKEYKELRGKISEYEISLEGIRYRIKGIENEIESNVKLLSDKISLSVKKIDIVKELNTELSIGKGIKLQGERFKVDTERFKVNEEGIQFKGEVNATTGKLGGFLISGNALIGAPNTSIGAGTINTAYMTMTGASAENIDCNPDNVQGKRVVWTSNRTIDKDAKTETTTSFKGEMNISGTVHAIYGWNQQLDPDGEPHGTEFNFHFENINVTQNCSLMGKDGSVTLANRARCSEIISNKAGDSWSDRRLKENIQEIDGEKVIELFRKITPVTYTLKKNGENGTGYIAQDLKKALEECGLCGIVEENNGYLGVRYGELIPLRIKMIQELYKRIMERKEKGNGDKGKGSNEGSRNAE